MRRRAFLQYLTAVGVLPWSTQARGQQAPRLAVLMPQEEGDAEGLVRSSELVTELKRLGWEHGRNIEVTLWWGASSKRGPDVVAKASKSRPTVFVAAGTGPLSAAAAVIKDRPIVFAQVSDPAGAGFVRSAARPSGNITGFTDYEYSFGSKWLELLREVVPVRRVGIIYDPANLVAQNFVPYIESEGVAQGIVTSRMPMGSLSDIEAQFETFARLGATRTGASGMIVLAGSTTLQNRDLLVSLADRHQQPTVYPYRAFAEAGGLISYGIDVLSMYRGAASYVDRILKGEKPSDLPVQFGNKLELVLNSKAARKLGVIFSSELLAQADEIIE